jgi:hypothetical protein
VLRRAPAFHLVVATLDWRNLMGRFDLEAGSVSLRTLLEFTAAARRVGAEVDASRWLVRPYVAGVEVTQGRLSRPVVVPRRPPIVSILSPQAGRPFFAGAPLRLWGAVTEDDGAPADPAACEWLMDGRPVARGADVWIAAPEPGAHRCTLVVRGRGGTTRVEAELRTLDSRETDPQRLAGADASTGAAARRARTGARRRGAGNRRRNRGRSR